MGIDLLCSAEGCPAAHLFLEGEKSRQGDSASSSGRLRQCAAQSLEFGHTKQCFENHSMRQAKIDQVQRYEETIEALRRAEQKYRSIFENATEGIFQTTRR
jgi:PAS domain-containing protein